MAENEQVTIKCSDACGFSVTGTQEFCESAYEGHKHQKNKSGSRWYHYLFSEEGFAVIIAFSLVVAALSMFVK